MRRWLKFLHTIGGIGLLGSMAALLICHSELPPPSDDITTYVAVRQIMDALAQTRSFACPWG